MSARVVGRVLAVLVLVLAMVGPLFLMVTNAFKSQHDITTEPFGWPTHGFSLKYVGSALTSPDFNVVAAYGVTLLFVVAINVLNLLVVGPASYAIARGTRRYHRIVMLVLLAGLFIPSQTLVIPVIYVLKVLGLMGTIPGFLLFETTLTVPTTVFLFVAFVQTVPRELDEAAKIDGASRYGTFWRVIFPLMRPVVATAMVLNSVGVWTDFVNPQFILGPQSGVYTVTTGVYAAISRLSTDYTVVYPNMLLATAPVIVFYVLMQRRIIGGLTSGAIKG
ncbi:carbohydrate ABC transporter permease [Catenulispora rubra]|uniref:carbohydrate ABC transporter permease n=1 Tax=Catenulispora rubra TaxID=280293 RepID=UPI002B26957C|nr:carbohydrate ABC transporter permease [Catenulispora rubra]